MNKRIDLHMHTLFSDGELLPSELARRAIVAGHEVIAITDHADSYNIDKIGSIVNCVGDINDNWDITVIPGVEITHVPIELIDTLAKKAKALGAKIVVVHGETLAEPVIKGTNWTAIESESVDVLAHPGLISEDEVELAKSNNVALELSARKGHSLANGHVAKLASSIGVDLIVNTDTHSPDDIITFNQAEKIAKGAGLNDNQVKEVLINNPKKILKRVL